jgi:hypothetical protein
MHMSTTIHTEGANGSFQAAVIRPLSIRPGWVRLMLDREGAASNPLR